MVLLIHHLVLIIIINKIKNTGFSLSTLNIYSGTQKNFQKSATGFRFLTFINVRNQKVQGDF